MYREAFLGAIGTGRTREVREEGKLICDIDGYQVPGNLEETRRTGGKWGWRLQG